MKASEWVKTLPDRIRLGDQAGFDALSKRDDAILQAVKNRNIVVDWMPVITHSGGRTAQFWVMMSPLEVGEVGDSIIVNTGERNQQMIADELQSVLPTELLGDEIYAQADVKLPTLTQGWWQDGSMADTSRMVEYDAIVKKAIAGRKGLVGNAGKYWLIHPKLQLAANRQKAVNYGWYQPANPPGLGDKYPTAVPGMTAIQAPLTGHTWLHTDYSQVVTLVSRTVYICEPADQWVGAERDGANGLPCTMADGSQGITRVADIYEMIDDPELKPLFVKNINKSLNTMRHPGVPWPGGQPTPAPFVPPDPVPPNPGPGPGPGPGPAPRIAGLSSAGKVAAVGLGLAAGYTLLDWWRRRS